MHRTSFVAFGVYDEELAKAFREILGKSIAYPTDDCGILVIEDGLLVSTRVLHDVDASCNYIIDSRLVDDGYDDFYGRRINEKRADNLKALTLENVLCSFLSYFPNASFSEDLKSRFEIALGKGAVDCEIFADDTDSFDQNKHYAFYHLKPSGKTECIVETYHGYARIPVTDNTLVIDKAESVGIIRCLGDTAIENVIFTKSVPYILSDALKFCPSVRRICIENKNVEIGEFAFSGCKNLEKVELPGSEILKNKSAWWEERFPKDALSVIALDYYDKKDHLTRQTTTDAVPCLRNLLKKHREDLIPRLLELRHPLKSRSLVFLMICASQEGREDVLAIIEKYAAENFKPQSIEKAMAEYYAKACGEKEKSDNDLLDEFSVVSWLEKESVIDGYKGVDTDVVIPGEIGGKKIRFVANCAFQNLRFIKSVRFSSDARIHRFVFAGCTSLETALLQTSVSENTFEGCSALKCVEIVGKKHGIARSAFKDCVSLEEVVFSDDLVSIGCGAFENTPRLKHREYDNGIYLGSEGNPYYAFIRLKDPTVNKCIIHPNAKIFAEDAFASSCESFELIIGEETQQGRKKKSSCKLRGFKDCKYLKNITIPAGITSLGRGAFEGCSSLETVSLPNTLTEIEDSAFKDCASMHEIDCPDSVAKIGVGAFEGCRVLEKVKLPDTIPCIGHSWFRGCALLETVDVPNSVKQINHNAFYDCHSLKEIVLPEGLMEIWDSAFTGCKKLAEIRIPNTVKIIGSHAFRKCSSLRKVILSSELKDINYSTFEGCCSLQSMKIPDRIKKIYRHAFENCSSLKEITISSSATTIELDAFKNCSGVVIKGERGSAAERFATQAKITFVAMDL